jgi:hypothetical protein
MRFFDRIKARWNAYLKKLADANTKSFGEGPLECCSLNRNSDDTGQDNTSETQSNKSFGK